MAELLKQQIECKVGRNRKGFDIRGFSLTNL